MTGMGWHCARQKAGLLAGLAGVLLPGPAVLWAQSAALLEVGKFSAARLRGHHFAAEARILPLLGGPHVPRFVAAGDISNCPYIAMEQIEGRSLEAIEAVRPVEPSSRLQNAVPWDDPSWDSRSTAGASARATGERRAARHRERVRAARPGIVAQGIATALIGVALIAVAPGQPAPKGRNALASCWTSYASTATSY